MIIYFLHTYILVSGITRRGCLSRLFPNNYCPSPCDQCTTPLCNKNIFPADRLQCHQCSGSNCINIDANSTTYLRPCPFYHENDRCYTNVIGISNTQRGCEYTNLPSTCPNVCLKCNYNGCNNEQTVLEESCVVCSHTTLSPNPKCLRRQDSSLDSDELCAVHDLEHCTHKMMLGHRGKCFTYVNEHTGVVNRGCSSNMGFYPTGTLKMCEGENCNSDCLTTSCNECDSMTDADGGHKCRMGTNLRATKCEEGTVACYSCESGE